MVVTALQMAPPSSSFPEHFGEVVCCRCVYCENGGDDDDDDGDRVDVAPAA